MSKLKPEHVYLVYDPKFVKDFSYGFPEAVYVHHTKAEIVKAQRLVCKHPDKFVVLMVSFDDDPDERVCFSTTVASMKETLKRRKP